jgi:hypothetical protein
MAIAAAHDADEIFAARDLPARGLGAGGQRRRTEQQNNHGRQRRQAPHTAAHASPFRRGGIPRDRRRLNLYHEMAGKDEASVRFAAIARTATCSAGRYRKRDRLTP